MIKQNMLYIQQAFRLVWKSASKWTAINAVLIFLQSAFPLIIIYLMKTIIDCVSTAINVSDKHDAINNLILIIIITGTVYLIQSFINSYSTLVREHQNMQVNAYMNNLIHHKSIELDFEYIENPKYQDLFHRASQEASFRPVKIVNGLFQLLQSVVSIVLLSVLLISLHWGIAIVLIIASLPEYFVRIRFARKIFDLQQQQTQDERKLFYYHRILTTETFAKEIRIFGLGEWFIKKFQELTLFLRNSRIKLIRNKTISELFAQLITVLAVFSTFVFIAFEAIEGHITIGSLVMYFMAFQKGMGYLKDLLNSISSLYEDNLFITNLNDFLKLQPLNASSFAEKKFPSPLIKGITFKNVCFKYPNTDRNVLNNINLFIPTGKTIAIVGENGAGKTTLIKLLCGLYQASSGQILFDDIPTDKFSESEIRSNISIVFQDYVLFNMTAKENIWFGDINKTIHDHNIKNAAQNAGIDSVLTNLSKGYDTTLGKLFKNSEELSIGEWQKIALAKAFYRDSQIIILDEPTSSLDVKTEFDLHQNFRKIIKDKTAILISHRFSTVKMADLIFVITKDSIAEQGSHEELLNKHGIYASFYKMQSEFH